MILPERVFGRPGAHWMKSGEAIGPISVRTQSRSSLRNGSVGSAVGYGLLAAVLPTVGMITMAVQGIAEKK